MRGLHHNYTLRCLMFTLYEPAVKKVPQDLRSRLAEKGVSPVHGWAEILLDRARAHPSKEIKWASCLVIGAAGSTTAEGLLPDYGARGLVVDIEVTSGVSESLCG